MVAPAGGQVILDGMPLLIQPGSYQRGESPLQAKAPLRGGSPISLSPFSTWKQESWEGGVGSQRWTDQAMYYHGSADTRHGYVQCNIGLQRNSGSTGGDNKGKLIAVRPISDSSTARLYEAGYGDTKLYRRSTLSAAPSLIKTFSAGISALGRSYIGGMFALHIGLVNGETHVMASGGETTALRSAGDTGSDRVTFIDSLGTKGDICSSGRSLFKLTAETNWKRFATVDLEVMDGEAWNQRMWFVGNDRQSKSKLYTSDTLSTQDVYTWPDGFLAWKIILHYGQLYIVGEGPNEGFNKSVGQLWAYNGASMRRVYEVPEWIWEPSSFVNWHFRTAVGYRKWLGFGFAHKGVFWYDPETDSMHPGPSLKGVTDDAGNYVTALATWGGQLIAGNFNETVAHYEKAPEREFVTSNLVSSEFDAGLPGTDKLWTQCRIRFAENPPTGSTIKVYVTTQRIEADDLSNPDWKLVAQIDDTYRSFYGVKRNYTLPIVLNVDFADFRSQVLRYRLDLTPTTYSGSAANETLKVEAVEFDYVVLDDVKWAWSFNVLAANELVYQGADYGQNAESVSETLAAMRRDPEKAVVFFTDRDGTEYTVRVTTFSETRYAPDPENPDGDHSIIQLGLAEVS